MSLVGRDALRGGQRAVSREATSKAIQLSQNHLDGACSASHVLHVGRKKASPRTGHHAV